MKDQKLHSKDNGTSFLYTSSYSYNERGWLKQMSGTEFSFELKYNDATGGMTAQYNGNIANQVYNNNGSNTFNYDYDKLNRLTSGSASGMTEVIDYDVMGNIKHLNRNSGGTALYSYTGNRLNSISGGGLTTGAYGYDGNGNATTDGRTGVTLTYNYLNLPATAVKSGLNLTYTYDAVGNKLRKLNSNTATTTDYVAGIQYTGGVIDFIQTENGIAKDTLGVYRYRYNLTDHLGNVRATIRESVATPGSLQVMQRDNYYAFGLTQVAGARNNKYLYNSKELQTELGQYDYGARFYDPVIGRWNVVDPLAELDRKTSPYAYVFNNPISFIDPDGMFGDYYKTNGEYLGSDGINDDKVYTADSKSIKKDKDGTSSTTFNNANQLSITHSAFQKQAATVYGESSVGYGIESKEEMFSIASVHQKNKIAFGANSPMAKKFLDASLGDRDGAMQIANSAVINAVTGGRDFSNGADQWDGAEQAMVSKTNMDKASNGRFMYKMNVMGWSMNDSHYNSWKSAVNSRFGEGKFSVPQEKAALHNYGGMTNKGKIRINSTAQYGLTMFWKTK